MNDRIKSLAEDGFETDNVLPMVRRATGGSGSSGGTTENWLRELPHGTRFLTRHKAYQGSELEDFVLLTDPKSMEVVMLGQNIQGHGSIRWHEVKRFSQDYRLIYTLEVVNVDDKPIHPAPVERLEEPQDVTELHETE